MILVKILMSKQITEDNWTKYYVEKLFNEFTTMNEIIEWAKNKNYGKMPNELIITIPEQ